MSSSAWLPESATEWTDSASIEADPVITKATNFVAAMPRLAANAAMTVLRPLPAALCSVLMIAYAGARPTERLALGRIARLVDEHDRDVVAHRVGQPAVGPGADEFAGLFIDAHRRVALRADQDLEQPVIDLHCISLGVEGHDAAAEGTARLHLVSITVHDTQDL